MYNYERVIDVCLDVISKHNDTNTFNDLVESEEYTLSLIEAADVVAILDYYSKGGKTYWQSGETPMQDITPYSAYEDVMKRLEQKQIE